MDTIDNDEAQLNQVSAALAASSDLTDDCDRIFKVLRKKLLGYGLAIIQEYNVSSDEHQVMIHKLSVTSIEFLLNCLLFCIISFGYYGLSVVFTKGVNPG